MSELTIRLKRLGKKRLHTVPYKVPTGTMTLGDLIRSCVAAEVARFNETRTDPTLISFLTPGEIQAAAEAGKVAFGEVASTKQADVEKATAVALQAHTDGVFVVFVGDEEVRDLTEEINLTEDSVVTFIRLTFLSGTFW